MIGKAYPSCPSCGRRCEPGVSWPGANLCRGLILLRVIGDHPGLSGWELSQRCGMPYADATRALLKLRDYEVVSTQSEPRADGTGIRYRYWPLDDAAARHRFFAAVRRAESYAGSGSQGAFDV